MTNERKKKLLDQLALLKELLKSAKCPNENCFEGHITTKTGGQYEQRVTRDMALDAGFPEMEGTILATNEYEDKPCQWCALRAEALKD